MSAPNVYELGGKVEIDVNAYDTNGSRFVPTYARLSVEDPTGTVVTYSGGIGVSSPDLLTASGYLYYLYRPPIKGWYQYEQWCADSTGREGTFTGGFEVTDLVRN